MKINTFRTGFSNYLPFFIFIILGFFPAIIKNPYQLRVLTNIAVFISFTYAANIIFGESRQLFLCMSALSGMGAYASGILSIHLGIDPWITLLIGILVSTAMGALLSYVSVSRGLGVIFVAIVTLAFTLIFENAVLGLRELTMGETGLLMPALKWPLQNLMDRRLASYYTILIFSALSAFIYSALVRSRLGIGLKAMRSDSVSSEAIGIDVTKYNVMAAGIGSAILGLNGGLYAYFLGMSSPGIFSPSMDITIFLMLILGGFGTLAGPIIGTIVIILIQELTRGLGQLTMTFFGILLVILILIFREGLSSIIEKAGRYLKSQKSV